VLSFYARQDSNLQPSVPKFEDWRFRKPRRNQEIGRYSLPCNDLREAIQFHEHRWLHRSRVGKRYRFEESSNPNRPSKPMRSPSDPMPSGACLNHTEQPEGRAWINARGG